VTASSAITLDHQSMSSSCSSSSSCYWQPATDDESQEIENDCCLPVVSSVVVRPHRISRRSVLSLILHVHSQSCEGAVA